MANFKGHLYGAVAVSSVAALGAYALGWVGMHKTLWMFLLGVTGGVLPDIDSDHSIPVRWFFNVLGVVLAFWASFLAFGHVPLWALIPVWALMFLFARFGLYEIFARFTVHRGIWHSWLATAFVGLASANLAYHLARWSAWEAWVAGLFMALGYLTHLSLDEIASVDLSGRRLRRSFGTALKPFSLAYPYASLGMLTATVVLAITAPTLAPVLAAGEYYGLDFGTFPSWLWGEEAWVQAARAWFE